MKKVKRFSLVFLPIALIANNSIAAPSYQSSTSSLTSKPASTLVLRPPVTIRPTAVPTAKPSSLPTVRSSATSTPKPTVRPSVAPTVFPTVRATVSPTTIPTIRPTVKPTVRATVFPSIMPSFRPTATTTLKPSTAPTVRPTTTATVIPTVKPTVVPSMAPTTVPTIMPTPETPFTCTSSFCPNNGDGICYESEISVTGEYKGGSFSGATSNALGKAYLAAMIVGEEVATTEVECTLEESFKAIFLTDANCVYDSAVKKLENEIAELKAKIAIEEAKKPQTDGIKRKIDLLNQQIARLQDLIKEHNANIKIKKDRFMQRCMDGFTEDCKKSNPLIGEEKLKKSAEQFCASEYNTSHAWQCKCQEVNDGCADQNCQCRSNCFSNHRSDEAARNLCLDSCEADEKACKDADESCNVKYCVKFKELKSRGTMACVYGTVF